jgi:hypothetical protein
MAQRNGSIRNIRTIKALRGQSLEIDLGRTLEGTIIAWMKKDLNSTTYRSFEVVDNRFLVLSKEKASDYYDITESTLIEAVAGKWFFDVRRHPDGGTEEDEEVVYSGSIDFENHITNSDGIELIDQSAYENPTRFIELFDTPATYGEVGQVITSTGTGLEWTTVDTDKNFVYEQGVPSSIWNVNHSLNKFPSVTAVDSAGSVVVGQVNHIDLNNITITFNASFSGSAYIN